MTHPGGTGSGAPRTAIVPAGGLGTRFLPATKTVPKELLPVLTTPAIELVATEAAQAGARRLLVVTSPSKDTLVAKAIADMARRGVPKTTGTGTVPLATVVQPQPVGLGDALKCVEPLLSPDEDGVFVLLPDAVLTPPGALVAMTTVREKFGGSVLCAVEVPPSRVSAYGVLDLEAAHDGSTREALRAKGIVEKPEASDAPSRFVAAGRYLLDRSVFDALRRTKIGSGGELQLTDAIALLIDEGHPVRAVVHHGYLHDLGNPLGYLEASVDVALDSHGYVSGLRQWLIDRLGDAPRITRSRTRTPAGQARRSKQDRPQRMVQASKSRRWQ
ncbi:UTP--glucose-1-phosphate uridylyltransferase [Mycolicibacterium elephantis]|uniref:UTP--glucose-1-phosphate uridylyltransferase n=1 Tax=Mycolicibacterium elephantis TaxID=81858 RepID=UPI0009F3DBA6|nr:UTP--glucose-1-phosphate uridylyltransferase [Mycolicibacterium elephantis]